MNPSKTEVEKRSHERVLVVGCSCVLPGSCNCKGTECHSGLPKKKCKDTYGYWKPPKSHDKFKASYFLGLSLLPSPLCHLRSSVSVPLPFTPIWSILSWLSHPNPRRSANYTAIPTEQGPLFSATCGYYFNEASSPVLSGLLLNNNNKSWGI